MINSSLSSTTVFFIANTLASIGLNIGIVGVNWFIMDATGQNKILGLYGACSLISAFITSALSSELTDRFSKMSLLRFCCFGQAALFFIIALLYACRFPPLGLIAILAVLNMPLMVLFSTLSRGAVPDVWKADTLSNGNAALEITLQIGAVCAALLTGFLYHTVGFNYLISLGGVLTAAAGIVLQRWPLTLTRGTNKTSYWKELTEGIIYLCQNRLVLLYGLAAFVPTLIISVSNTVIPGYVAQTLHRQAFTYGLGDMAFGLGALGAGLLGGRLFPVNRPLYSYGLFGAIFLCLSGLALGKSVLLFYGIVFLLGILLAQLRISLNTVFMEHTHPLYIGRSLSLLLAVSMAIQAFFSYVAGVLMDRWGASNGFWLLILLALTGPIFLAHAKSISKN